MIFDKARMAKLSGLMTEGKGGIKDPMADQFGGGDVEGLPEELNQLSESDSDPEEGVEPGAEEQAVREMIRSEMRRAKKQMEAEQADKKDEKAVREAVRKEIRSVLRSRGVTMGGTGWGFKR